MCACARVRVCRASNFPYFNVVHREIILLQLHEWRRGDGDGGKELIQLVSHAASVVRGADSMCEPSASRVDDGGNSSGSVMFTQSLCPTTTTRTHAHTRVSPGLFSYANPSPVRANGRSSTPEARERGESGGLNPGESRQWTRRLLCVCEMRHILT